MGPAGEALLGRAGRSFCPRFHALGKEENDMTATILIMGGLAAVFLIAPFAAMAVLKKRGGSWPDFFVGAGIFFLFALVLESAMHNVVLLRTPLGAVLQGNIWLYGLYGGLAAGIFEETGRLVAFRFILKKHRTRVTALGYGIGHGGCEAALLLSVTYISNIVLLSMANLGELMTMASAGGALPQELQAAVAQLAEIPAATFLWAGLERISAMALHMAFSVLVFAAVTQPGKRNLFFAAVLIHAAVDFCAVVSNAFFPIIVTELLMAALAALAVWFAADIYKKLPEISEKA